MATDKNQKAVNETAKMLSALGEPTRLKIVETLRTKGSMTVTEISKALGIDVVNTSHHLKLLDVAGLISKDKTGRIVNVTLNSDTYAKGTFDFGMVTVSLK